MFVIEIFLKQNWAFWLVHINKNEFPQWRSMGAGGSIDPGAKLGWGQARFPLPQQQRQQGDPVAHTVTCKHGLLTAWHPASTLHAQLLAVCSAVGWLPRTCSQQVALHLREVTILGVRKGESSPSCLSTTDNNKGPELEMGKGAAATFSAPCIFALGLRLECPFCFLAMCPLLAGSGPC